jgi:hypothetical protein
MTVSVTDYADSDKVRGILGLTVSELSDTQVTNAMLAESLLSDLDEWLPTHATVYSDGTSGSQTAQQLANLRNLQLYSAYYCASRIDMLKLYVPQSVTNGKDAFKRFEGADFTELAARLLAEAGKYRDLLEDAVNGTEATGRVALIGLSIPDYDPVTNT